MTVAAEQGIGQRTLLSADQVWYHLFVTLGIILYPTTRPVSANWKQSHNYLMATDPLV